MNIILTGATGTAGSQVLRQLLPNPAIGHITVLARSAELPSYITDTLPAHESSRLTVVEHPDFKAYSRELLARPGIKDAGAIIWALGVSQQDVSKEAYIEITYDYAMRAAEALETLEKPPRFIFLSGQGATQDESGIPLFAKVKGRTEAHLTDMLGERAFHFRPPFIAPIVSRPATRAKWAERIGDACVPLFERVFPRFVTRTDTLARAMIEAALHGVPGPQRIFGQAEIERLAASASPGF